MPTLLKARLRCVLTLALLGGPSLASAGGIRRPTIPFEMPSRANRAVIGVMIDKLRRDGDNGQVTFSYNPAVRDGSSAGAYRDDLTDQFTSDPRFGWTGIPTGEFGGGLILELAHLTSAAALELVGKILSGPIVMRFDHHVDFRSATVVVNWPRPADEDLAAFGREISAMWDRVLIANGPGRTPTVLMTMDPPAVHAASVASECVLDLIGS